VEAISEIRKRFNARRDAIRQAIRNRGKITLSEIATDSGISLNSVKTFVYSHGSIGAAGLERLEPVLKDKGLL